jgi:parallel beta-helix repeat protein
VQTGCFSGDAAGYPVTIDGTAGRSYRLTGDLIVPDENTDGIVLSTSDIGIDLNNFTIIRQGCVGKTINCIPARDSGSGSGVARTSFLNRGISVKNGSITGMGLYGVILGDQAEVSGLRVRWNGRDGIFVSKGSTVWGNTAYQNGDDGIQTSSGSTVSRNTAYQNGGDGPLAAYRENVVDLNISGTVLGGVDAGGNVCNGSLSCP